MMMRQTEIKGESKEISSFVMLMLQSNDKKPIKGSSKSSFAFRIRSEWGTELLGSFLCFRSLLQVVWENLTLTLQFQAK